MIDHLVLFAVKDDISLEDLEDLTASARALKDKVSSVVDMSVGEDFSGRGGDYTHGLYARFEDRDGLKEYLTHEEHVKVVQKLDARTTGRLVVDYEV